MSGILERLHGDRREVEHLQRQLTACRDVLRRTAAKVEGLERALAESSVREAALRHRLAHPVEHPTASDPL